MRPAVLGASACLLAIRGQGLLTDLSTRPNGTLLYAAGVVLLLLAWRGTYRNRDPSSPVRSDRAPGPRSLSRRQLAIILLAIGVNVLAVLELRRMDYDSIAAGAVWVVSLLLLGFATLPMGGKAPGSAEPNPTRHEGVSHRFELGLLALIFLLGLGLRVYRLGDWTGGIHGDEGQVGLDAMEILRHPRISPFRTGWFGQPNFYYWGVAVGMKVFGTGLAGLRAFSVIAGTLLPLCLYPLVRRFFGFRTAIFATFLVAISGPAIHFSRQEFSNITTPLFLVAGFFFFFKGLESRRPLHFVLAGYAHLACLYFYLGGRLTPLVAIAFFLYLVVAAPLAGLPRAYREARFSSPASPAGDIVVAALRRRFRRQGPLWLGIGFYGLAALCMASPWISYYGDHRLELDSRVREKLIFNRAREMGEAHHAGHEPLSISLPGKQVTGVARKWTLWKDGFWPRVLWGQLRATLSVLTWNYDRSGVYTTGEPATKPLEAVLVVFGIAWALWRWRDARMAMLSLWFWLTILVGGTLTIDAPYLARLVGILPLLAVFSAIVLDKLALELERLWRRTARGAGRAEHARLVLNFAAALVLALLARRNLADYFGRYLGERPFPGGVGFATFVRDCDTRAARERRPAPKYYALGAHQVYWSFSVNRFLNPQSVGVDVENVSDALPLLDNQGRDAVFLVWDDNRQYLPILRLCYPDGREAGYRYGRPGEQVVLFRYYTVRRESIDAERSVSARYDPIRGAKIERAEIGAGSITLPPEDLAYPARARWSGQLVAPAFGEYRFRLEGEASASLSLDGTTFVESDGSSAETAVVLSRGIHSFVLDGILSRRDARVVLTWSAGGSRFAPVSRRFFWAGPGRSLLGAVRWTEGEKERIEYRTDGFLGFRDTQTALGIGRPVAAAWQGSLRVPAAGTYYFDTFSNGPSSIFLDDRLVLDNRLGDGVPRSLGAAVELTAGEHAVDIHYRWNRGFGHLEVYWTSPGAGRSLLGPPALSTKGGAWRHGEVPEARTLTPDLTNE